VTADQTDDQGDLRELLLASATRLFDRLPQPTEGAQSIDPAAWAEVEAAGFGRAMLPEDDGGLGPEQGLALVRLAAERALMLPLAETVGSTWLAHLAGLDLGEGPWTFTDGVLELEPLAGGWSATGNLRRVPWGRAGGLVVLGRSGQGLHLVVLARRRFLVTFDANLAGEPRDDSRVEAIVSRACVAPLPAHLDANGPRRLGAALRSVQIAGATDAALRLTVGYVRDRRQFGRPLAGFQAVQQLLAVMADDTAAAGVAADLACEAVAQGLDPQAIAAAKIRAGMAAGRVAAGAHQAHGAIGFTREYELHRLSGRLWSWRDEFGGESEWAASLGRHLLERRAPLWPQITAI